jgi:hypothetical protein
MIADVQRKVQCIIWLAERKAIVTVKCNCCHVCGQGFIIGEMIQHWFKQFKESGHVEMHKLPG